MIGLQLQVRPAAPSDHQALSSLIFFETHVHRHLDWRAPLDWLGSPDFWVAEENGRILAALACPADPPGVAWIRLFIHSGSIPAGLAWSRLWERAKYALAERGGTEVGIIAQQQWIRPLLLDSGFDLPQTIVLLEWQGRPVLMPELPFGIHLRAMTEEDLPAVAEVDASAFAPFWTNSLDSLRRAFPQSTYSTVMESDEGLLAYQLSTGHPLGAHLARLAVRKEAQGNRLGEALVADLILHIRQRGLSRLTVNTQSDNRTSLSLYQKMGFLRTGEEFPVYRYEV
jgi:ribosomal protein S18 acetylase RimI-like enzyme